MAKRQTASRHNAAERMAGKVLLALVVLAVIFFGAFYLVGYDMPFVENPAFNAPLLTDVLLVFIYVLLAVSAVLVIVGMAWGVRSRGSAANVSNGVPVGRIGCAVAALLAASLAVSYFTGSAEAVYVNGKVFTDAVWLRLADMFIATSAVMFVVAAMAVAYGAAGLNRRFYRKKNVQKT